MKTDGILFDLDGTLWNAVERVLAAWNEAISRHPGLRPPLTKAELQGYMGLPMDVIAQRMFPAAGPAQQAELLEECCRVEHEYLARQGGTLYPRLEETLAALAQDRPLFIVSNCEDGYIQCFFEASGLQRYFTDFECYGATLKSKGENNKLVIARNGLKAPIYVGDTAGDAESARVAGIPFVYARYGFGQVEHYDYAIDAVDELLVLVEK